MQNRKILVTDINKASLVTENKNEIIDGDNQVIVKNLYSHISAGTELACIAGLESFFKIPGTPGYTAVGKIIEKSKNITHLELGDLIYTYGAHTELFKIDITDRWHGVCVKIPEGIDPVLATFAHMAGIAATALRASNIELGDDVLITGLGAIGNLISQLSQLQGANVIAADINSSRIEVAKKCGIKTIINNSVDDLKTKVASITENRLVSTYIDATGSPRVIADAVNLVALYGETILLGSPRAPFETNITDFMKHFHYLPWCHNLKGALEFSYPTHQTEFVKHSIERNAWINLNLINTGKLRISPLLSHLIHPSEIQSAYDGLRNNPDNYYGVVIDWSK